MTLASTSWVSSEVSALLVLSEHQRLASLWIPLVLTSEKNEAHQICVYHIVKSESWNEKATGGGGTVESGQRSRYEKIGSLLPLIMNVIIHRQLWFPGCESVNSWLLMYYAVMEVCILKDESKYLKLVILATDFFPSNYRL